jgi:hypothetical protein
MFEARILKPVTPAVAVGTGARVGGSLKHDGLPGMAPAAVANSRHRGISR